MVRGKTGNPLNWRDAPLSDLFRIPHRPWRALLHPVLEDPMAGLAFIVSAVALIGSGAFPLVIEKLKENEEA
jgi:hypothetical protein